MIELKRLHHWEESLSLYLDRTNDDLFKWGVHDCALFTAGAIQSMTATDPAEAFRGTYSSARGAALALRQHGAGTLLKTVKAWLGDPMHAAQAHRGDIVMLNASTCGVCVGKWSIFTGQEESNFRQIHLPTLSCKYAFRLPY